MILRLIVGFKDGDYIVKTSNTMVFQDGYPFTNYFDVKM